MIPPQYPIGRLVAGSESAVRAARERFQDQPIDLALLDESGKYPFSARRTTLGGVASCSGPGTFRGSERSTLTFGPSSNPGWWIDRADLPDQFPIGVSVRNVWTTARNIVLRSGNPHNYLRMVEHIVAFRLGLGIDDATVSIGSGDPPLFDRGNYDIYEAIMRAGIVEKNEPAPFITVREPLTFGGQRGDFLTFLPAEPGQKTLRVDCAVDFHSAIGRQRIVYDLSPEAFRQGCQARTNAPYSLYLYTRTIGKIFADTRNLGYTKRNILIHGRRRYLNEPGLLHDGRSLEAVWHRATLDLLAAVSLLDGGRFAGTVVSYRAGHTQDVMMCSALQLHSHLVPLPPA
ncbi:MAG: UDP-3-O-acyl-N-acetylglucosamine deacetylase [Kiritimatiellae bacterium]|nr:UDP-3-O-acyl-N-acetylglucosamine deacetylase [Kiritimatiellia bacterium]